MSTPVLDEKKLQQMTEFALSHQQILSTPAFLNFTFWRKPQHALIALVCLLVVVGSWTIQGTKDHHPLSEPDLIDYTLYQTLDDLVS
jgi:hypothetical protein